MKKRFVLIGLILALNSTAFAQNKAYSVKTTTGETVEISTQVLLDAYEAFTKDSGINVIVTNGDGSKTVLNPRIMFEGEMRRLAIDSSPEGLCVHFGLKNIVTFREVRLETLEPVASIYKNGKVYVVSPQLFSVDSITCN